MRTTFRIFTRLFLAVVIGIVAIFAVANRSSTKIDLSPLPFAPELPLFIVILGAMAIGLVIGAGLSSYSRQKLKWQARTHRKRAEALEKSDEGLSTPSQIPQARSATPGRRLALNED
jgi:putative membrane protein